MLEEGGLLILDGLDEVPDEQRERIKDGVLTFIDTFPRVRILLTSRTYAYQNPAWQLPDFGQAVLAPFTAEQVDLFIDRWYVHQAQIRPSLLDATGRAALLKSDVHHHEHLADLAQRPLLLTLIASLHAYRGGSLPEDRAQLYRDSVDLLLDFWQRPKTIYTDDGSTQVLNASLAAWLEARPERLRKALEKLTYEVHATQGSRQGTADISQSRLVEALLSASDNPNVRPVQVIAYIRDRAGLLVDRGGGIYSFPHRSFQEYLAACYLTDTQFPSLLVKLAREAPERWREVTLLAGAKSKAGTVSAPWSLVNKLCPRPCPADGAGDTDWWTALMAGEVLLETRIYQEIDPQIDVDNVETLQRVKAWLTRLVSEGHLPPVDRAAAARALGWQGDQRRGVGAIIRGSVKLPDIDWVPVEAGSFIMGEGREQFTCRVIAQPYRISRYPVTVAQYGAFVDAGGYGTQRYWTNAGWRWRVANRVTTPQELDRIYQTPNQPQVGVTWYEAVAFCAWLSEALGQAVRLPTEAEWERAGRHTDGRTYPWGNEFELQRCNMLVTGIGAPCAVGMFPAGNAECGAADMAGNVWEWCCTKWLEDYKDYERRVNDSIEGGDRRVVRGGAFDHVELDVRCAIRRWLSPGNWNRSFGFRVVSPGF